MVSQAQLLCKISHACITTFGHCGEQADKFGSICLKTGNGSNHTFKNTNKLVCTAITTYLKRICTSYGATCILSCSELRSCNKLLSQHYPRVFHTRISGNIRVYHPRRLIHAKFESRTSTVTVRKTEQTRHLQGKCTHAHTQKSYVVLPLAGFSLQYAFSPKRTCCQTGERRYYAIGSVGPHLNGETRRFSDKKKHLTWGMKCEYAR